MGGVVIQLILVWHYNIVTCLLISIRFGYVAGVLPDQEETCTMSAGENKIDEHEKKYKSKKLTDTQNKYSNMTRGIGFIGNKQFLPYNILGIDQITHSHGVDTKIGLV